MEFPFHISIGSFDIHPHFFFDVIAYFIAYQIYRKQRPKNYLGSDSAHPIGLLIYAITGAFLFSKCLAWLEHPFEYFSIWSNKDMNVFEKLSILNQGKTIVGGIIGGWMGVELYKAKRKINTSSGDCYAIPLCIGMMIGRIGCFLTGLEDKTHGQPSTLPWAIDFGDGITRHPTQLYEILFLLFLFITLLVLKSRTKLNPGLEFKIFVILYLIFRFMIEFIKPIYLYPWGLSMIQTFSGLVLIYLALKLIPKPIYYAD